MTCDNCGNCKPKAVTYYNGELKHYGVEYKGKFYPFGGDDNSKCIRDSVLRKSLDDNSYIETFAPCHSIAETWSKRDG